MTTPLFLDLSPNWCGWAVGRGCDAPLAGAFLLPKCGDDLGKLGGALEEQVLALVNSHRIGALGYESPILRPHDNLLTLRRIYGLGWEIEQMARALLLPCREVDCRKVKSALTGDSFADKKAMIEAALRLGISLPDRLGEGRDDAADAVGGLFEMMAEFDLEGYAHWQSQVAKMKGALI